MCDGVYMCECTYPQTGTQTDRGTDRQANIHVTNIGVRGWWLHHQTDRQADR